MEIYTSVAFSFEFLRPQYAEAHWFAKTTKCFRFDEINDFLNRDIGNSRGIGLA